MQIKIALEGENSAEETTDLKNWLHRERISDVTELSQKEQPPAPGEQGPTLLAILGVVLGAKATVELVRSLHRWIETRRRKIVITIEVNGKKVVVECENPQDIDSLIQSVASISYE